MTISELIDKINDVSIDIEDNVCVIPASDKNEIIQQLDDIMDRLENLMDEYGDEDEPDDEYEDDED